MYYKAPGLVTTGGFLHFYHRGIQEFWHRVARCIRVKLGGDIHGSPCPLPNSGGHSRLPFPGSPLTIYHSSLPGTLCQNSM